MFGRQPATARWPTIDARAQRLPRCLPNTDSSVAVDGRLRRISPRAPTACGASYCAAPHSSRTKNNEWPAHWRHRANTLHHSITDYNLHVPANALFIAFLFGIIANPTAETPATTLFASNRWLRFLAPAVSLLLLVKAWPLVYGEYLAERTRIAFREGDYENVVAYADRALQRERANADLPYLRGEAYLRVGIESPEATERDALLRKAIASFQEGIKIFPQDSRLWTALARSHDQLREFELAEKAFKQAFTFDPGSADIYAAYGLHWQLQDQLAKANEVLQRARFLRRCRRGRRKTPPPARDPPSRPPGSRCARAVRAGFHTLPPPPAPPPRPKPQEPPTEFPGVPPVHWRAFARS